MLISFRLAEVLSIHKTQWSETAKKTVLVSLRGAHEILNSRSPLNIYGLASLGLFHINILLFA